MELTVNNTDVALWWENGLEVDSDGAPNSYHSENKDSLDYLANAGSPGNWFGIVTGADGEPAVQGPSDPFPGYYISTTALVDHERHVSDPHRYVDSTKVPYISVPSNAIHDMNVRVGDVGIAFCRKTGKCCAAVVADVGPKNKYGEGSIALAQSLGIPSSPKNGGIESGVVVIVFKNSHKSWPRSNEDVASQVQDLLNANPGLQALLHA